VAIVLGTLAGAVATSALALVLAVPRLLSTGLQPAAEGHVLGWLVSPDVSEPVTRALLWILGLATLLLAGLVGAGARRRLVWQGYAAWALVGGVLTTYALVANWPLAREAGLLAFAVGALWSGAVALGIAQVHRRERSLGR